MRRCMMLLGTAMLALFMVCGNLPDVCAAPAGPDRAPSKAPEKTITKTIVGSAESPDPVLEKIRQLEKDGILKKVSVMESFPLKIRVTGPASVIEKLEKMPRKKLTLPK